jgi:Signal transduction protein containing GAF and PtsI domains
MSTVARTLYAPLLAAVRQVFNAHAAVLFAPDDTGRFSCSAADTPDETVQRGIQVEPGKGLVGWIIRNRRPLIVNGFEQHNSHIGYYESQAESRITAFMGYPLPNGTVLCVDCVRDRQFSEADLETLLALGELTELQLPVVSSDTDDIRRYFTRLELVQQLRVQSPQWRRYLPAFLKLVTEATRFDIVAFATRPDNTDTFIIEAESIPLLLEEGMPTTFPLAGSVTGWVFRNDVPVHTDGLEGSASAALFGKVNGVPEFRSMICVPISINKATTAALCLGGIEPRPIPQAMRSFIRMAADELVQFLEALYLRHRVRSLMPRAKVYRHGATAYNPDTAPHPQEEEV